MPANRFSQLYLARNVPQEDSVRARSRLGAHLWDTYRDFGNGGERLWREIAVTIHRELGVVVNSTQFGYRMLEFINECQLRDLLDSITLIFGVLKPYAGRAESWRRFVERVFDEERLCYCVDDGGVVHFKVDAEYEGNLASAIAAVSPDRFAAVRDALERAKEDLARAQPDTIDAIRNAFEAAESLFKLVTDSNVNLDVAAVRSKLKSYVDKKMIGADDISKGAAAQMLEGFADWVNACHKYRHGHNAEAPPELPHELAVLMLSTCSAYLRWVATLESVEAL